MTEQPSSSAYVTERVGPDAPAVTLYGVAHIDPGGYHVTRYRDRDDAERALWDCKQDDADCYLIRATVAWEKVPDGE